MKYTHIPTETLQDARLTWAARGLLAYLLASDGAPAGIDDLAGQSPMAGRARVQRILAELEAYGYVQRLQERLPDGTYGQMTVDVYEVPREVNE